MKLGKSLLKMFAEEVSLGGTDHEDLSLLAIGEPSVIEIYC